ncbi:MAG: hypothetical protein HOV80_35370 [Polyangiaceae bacterium]|nr:hypothetical protein [Polyangiaceae bacterium]
MPIQLVLAAALVVFCLVGWRIESKRVKGWQLGPDTRLPKHARKLFISGGEPWVVLGISEESSFENISAPPEIESSGFEAKDESGATFSVSAGTKVQIRSIEGARRAPLDAITKGGVVRPRFTLELKPGAVVYTTAPAPKEAPTALYRAGSTPLLGIGGKQLVLSGTPGALAGTAFPGCWLLILFPFGLGGLIAAGLGVIELGWIAIGVGAALTVFGFAALPEKPPTEPAPNDRS